MDKEKDKELDRLLTTMARKARRAFSRLDLNPMLDPRASSSRRGGARDHRETNPAAAEFTPTDIIEIRLKFHASQRRFAETFGISVETLRNWEQGKRRPQGPARALLRVARANPEAVARVLWRSRRAWWAD